MAVVLLLLLLASCAEKRGRHPVNARTPGGWYVWVDEGFGETEWAFRQIDNAGFPEGWRIILRNTEFFDDPPVFGTVSGEHRQVQVGRNEYGNLPWVFRMADEAWAIVERGEAFDG